MNKLSIPPSKRSTLNVKRLTVYLPSPLDKQLRQLAKTQGRSLSMIAERAFQRYLSVSRNIA